MTDVRQHEQSSADAARARKSAVRTAWLFAGIAVAVYVGFMLLGAMGR